MPSVARPKPRAARMPSVCICGHGEVNHRQPIDASTGEWLPGQPQCRARVAHIRISGRARVCVTSPCPCRGYGEKGEFTEV